MKIQVRYEGYEVHLINDEWRCAHNNVEVQAPCCRNIGSSGYIECGCGGSYRVYCPDCKGEDMRDYEADDIFASYMQNEGDDYDRYE